MFFYIIFLHTHFDATPCIAGSNDDSIISFDDNITVRTSLMKPMLDFEIQDANHDGESLNYTANVPSSIKMGITYKYFGLSASKGIRDIERENRFGKTKYTDFQFNYYYKHYGCELFFQKYKGYYLKNPEKFGYTTGDSNSTRSDIKTQSIGLRAYYFFSDNFSMNAFVKQTERQSKWDWSFFIAASVGQFKVNSSRSIIPDNQIIYYDNNSNYQGGKYTIFSILPGFAITIPFYNFFISSSLCIGPGYSISKYKDMHCSQKEIDRIFDGNIKFAAGYNGDTYLFGLVANCSTFYTEKSNKELEIKIKTGYGEFFGGIRF